MSKQVKLVHESGAVVTVDESKVAELLRRGFSEPPAPAPKRSTPKKK